MSNVLVRLAVVIALCVATFVSTIVVAFRYPDATWAQRWIDHPEEMLIGLVLGLSCCAIAWWPKRKSRGDGPAKRIEDAIDRRLAERDRSITDKFGSRASTHEHA